MPPNTDAPVIETPQTVAPDVTTEPVVQEQPAAETPAKEYSPAPAPEPALFSDEEVAKLNEKVEKKGYEPTEEELDKFRLWREGKKSNVPSEGTPPVTEGEPQPEQGTSLDGSDPLAEVLKIVGAKDTSELPEKVKGLQKQMTATGGKLGEKVKTLEEKLEKETEGFRLLLSDALSGKKEALQYVKEHLKLDIPSPQAAEPEEEIPADVVDVATFRLLKQEIAELKKDQASFKAQAKAVEERSLKEQAHNEWVETLSNLAKKYPSLAPKTKDLGTLLRSYWEGKDEDPIDPELQPMLDLVRFARETGRKNYEDAYIVRERDEWEKNRLAELLAAEKRGLEKATQHAPSKGLSSSRPTGTTDASYSPVTEEEAHKMLRGDLPIPDEWRDAGGMIIRPRVPRNLWPIFFQ